MHQIREPLLWTARTRCASGGTGPATAQRRIGDLISALDPTFRAQELGFAVSQMASNIDLTTAAEQRSWLDRMLGRQARG